MESEYLTQESRPTSSLASLLPPLPVKKTKNLGERQALINKVAYELGIEKHYLSGLFWSTKILLDSEIISLKEEALKFKKNPGALFRILCKNKRKEIAERRAEIKITLNETPTT